MRMYLRDDTAPAAARPATVSMSAADAITDPYPAHCSVLSRIFALTPWNDDEPYDIDTHLTPSPIPAPYPDRRISIRPCPAAFSMSLGTPL